MAPGSSTRSAPTAGTNARSSIQVGPHGQRNQEAPQEDAEAQVPQAAREEPTQAKALARSLPKAETRRPGETGVHILRWAL